ncbi:MAG: DsbA family protein, partial [Gammaproteobacteria bacterium]|nr:DsbA family protein [Gammaproteobacteria bacterium]
FDYNCPICRNYTLIVSSVAKANPDLKVIDRVVPIIAKTSPAIDSAVLASYLQNKFSEMQWAVLHVPDPETIPISEVKKIAKKIGLDLQKLAADMSSDTIKKELLANLTAYSKLNQTRVPITVVYSNKNPDAKKIFVGEQSFAELQQAINQLKEQ